MDIYLAGGLTGNLSPFYQSIASKQASKQARRNFLAGDGYHQSEDFLNEAKNKMRIFLAGDGYHQSEDFSFLDGVTNFKDFNILESFYALRENESFMSLLVRCNSYLLDSGAFTFMQGTHQGAIDWDEYIEQYADLINRYDVKLFFELDIDSIVGLKEVERLREKLERLTNKQSIPVWHINRGKEDFIKIAKDYPYIALGGIALREIPLDKFEKYFPWFINTAHENGAKIHGLGYTRIKNLKKYKFDSVDSTAWLYGNRAGYIYKFHPETGEMEQIEKREGTRLKARMTALHNFIEWVKLGKYAQKYY